MLKAFFREWLTFCDGEQIGWGFSPGVKMGWHSRLTAMSAQGRPGYSICITSFVHCFAENQ